MYSREIQALPARHRREALLKLAASKKDVVPTAAPVKRVRRRTRTAAVDGQTNVPKPPIGK